MQDGALARSDVGDAWPALGSALEGSDLGSALEGSDCERMAAEGGPSELDACLQLGHEFVRKYVKRVRRKDDGGSNRCRSVRQALALLVTHI